MTLTVSAEFRARRHHLMRKQYDTRVRLLAAYTSGSEKRIRQAKVSLIRILREQSESPELGPRLPFIWGQLEVVYRGNFDPDISWEACEETLNDWWKVAKLLETSLKYD